MHDDTKAVHAGRHPERFEGAVNPPVFHASTILSPTLEDWNRKKAARARDVPGTYYGRLGTPTTQALEEALTALEGGYRTMLVPSGLAACTTALLAFVEQGAHVLVPDSVYAPTRNFATRFLKRFGVETTFYDPLAGSGIAGLLRDATRVIFLESPGSLTFEIQDVPAICAVARARGIITMIDNTWATPLYCKPLALGVDVSIQAATKYVVGHSDAMLGAITANESAWPRLRSTHRELGHSAAPDDVYLAQRGLRTMAVRLARHWETGLRLAEWIGRQPEVERVLHPALPGDPGHVLWKRDFTGASGLFGIVLKPVGAKAFAALVDGLELFGLGASWGGFESLIMPIHPEEVRSATKWSAPGPCFRIHAGLEHPDDLTADLAAGFARLRAAL
ncbi:MAG TPA: cystathionine beta-lyase [Burkholderiales bacterium]|nr:cystathionine beta-lyase [Burkholderiales bacterium]